MPAFIVWYLLVTLLGWITFPLAYYLFPALSDRGYTLSRAFGMLFWGYVFWLFASLGIAQNDMGGLLLGLVILAGLSAWAFVNRKSEIVNWLGENRRVIITTEVLFIVAFGFMGIVRAANPEILGTEKPMELMMINGIMNSPTFPPRDLWLSGYSISYYHFGYVMTSMLAIFTGVPATLAFNLMLALIFGLSAIGAYGVLYNLLSMGRATTVDDEESASNETRFSFLSALFAPLYLLIMSNVEGFLEVLHSHGLFWKDGPNFWTWLDIMDLRDAPTLPLTWAPTRYYWWWRASRVVQDYEFNGAWRETIDEFPAFSYILGDLHPHVLAMPFVLLAVAMALNIFLGGWRGNINLYFGQLRISKTGFFVSALMLGGLAFLNTWDILIAGALIVFSYMLAQVREAGWGWERLEDVLLLGIPVMIVAYIMYLPFFIGFSSQAGGILPNFMFVTRGAQLWVMWGTLLVPLFAYLIYLWRNRMPANWRAGIFSALGLVLVLLAAMFGLGLLALKIKPDLIDGILSAQKLTVGGFVAASMARRLTYIGGLLTILALLIPVFSFLFHSKNESEDQLSTFTFQRSAFILLLIALGSLLIVGPDFVYLSDNFGYRINTVFKFYYQAWIVLSLASAYGTVVLLRKLRGVANGIFSVIVVFVLLIGLTYPVLGVLTKTNNFKPSSGFTLNDFDRVQRETPDEAAAMLWLRSAPDGIEAEAVGGAYSAYARVSIYTGLPTVLGWGNHEGQWRDYSLQGSREQDIAALYTTPDWNTAHDIIARYNIRYIYIGNLERSTYRVNEEKFKTFLKPVFQQGIVTIYEVP
jgi:YYY domain-containing protein